MELNAKAAYVSAILKELEIPVKINPQKSRYTIQKAIYLA